MTATRSNSFSNNHDLAALKESLKKVEAPAREYAPVNPGDTYKTTRNRSTTYVVVDRVKGDKIVLKRDADAKDSFTISRAKFENYYVKVDK